MTWRRGQARGVNNLEGHPKGRGPTRFEIKSPLIRSRANARLCRIDPAPKECSHTCIIRCKSTLVKQLFPECKQTEL